MPGEAPRAIRIAILAMGGQGGGVLADWIVELAEAQGWFAQSTSVPGVAQRTGATIYYIEMLPAAAKAPVLALMPTPGDVDIVMAAEFMEAGRSILRGLVTPDRTTLIASTHRAFAVAEKENRDRSAPMIVLSTAHPAKFPDAVEAACGTRPALPDWLADLDTRPERVTVLPNDQGAVEKFIMAASRAAREGAAA